MLIFIFMMPSLTIILIAWRHYIKSGRSVFLFEGVVILSDAHERAIGVEALLEAKVGEFNKFALALNTCKIKKRESPCCTFHCEMKDLPERYSDVRN